MEHKTLLSLHREFKAPLLRLGAAYGTAWALHLRTNDTMEAIPPMRTAEFKCAIETMRLTFDTVSPACEAFKLLCEAAICEWDRAADRILYDEDNRPVRMPPPAPGDLRGWWIEISGLEWPKAWGSPKDQPVTEVFNNLWDLCVQACPDDKAHCQLVAGALLVLGWVAQYSAVLNLRAESKSINDTAVLNRIREATTRAGIPQVAESDFDSVWGNAATASPTPQVTTPAQSKNEVPVFPPDQGFGPEVYYENISILAALPTNSIVRRSMTTLKGEDSAKSCLLTYLVSIQYLSHSGGKGPGSFYYTQPILKKIHISQQ